MIERVLSFGNRFAQIIEMENVAGVCLRLALDHHPRTERMPVNAGIGRAGSRARQEVGGLELEVFVDAHEAGIGETRGRGNPLPCRLLKGALLEQPAFDLQDAAFDVVGHMLQIAQVVLNRCKVGFVAVAA